MSERAASGFEDLMERLKAASDDVVLLREIVESSDSASIAAAFARLFAGGGTSVPNESKLQKKTRNRPCPRTPNETFADILLFLDRDTLDAMQLACRFLLEFIGDREASGLPLRSLSQVNIGCFERRSCSNCYGFPVGSSCYWLPVIEVLRDTNVDEGLLPNTVNQLVSYLRVAYCESVCMDLRWPRPGLSDKHRGATRGTVFGDLVVSNTFVNVLTVCVEGPRDALYAFEAFKPLSKVVVKVGDYKSGITFKEAFFISAAECGVRSITFESIPRAGLIGVTLVSALSFGFANPTIGGDRNISGVLVFDEDDEGWGRNFDEDFVDLLLQLVMKARELDGRQHTDFKFTIDKLSKPIDPAGFDKYQKDKCSWLIDDLQNGVALEVVEAELSVEIHVFSSV